MSMFLKSLYRLLGLCAVTVLVFGFATNANAQTASEDFNANPPNWVTFGQPAADCAVCDFKWSNTANAGGAAGEGGGTLARLDGGATNVPVSYGVSLGGALTLDDTITFSAKIFDSGDTEPHFGFYTEGTLTSNGNDPSSFLGLSTDVGNTFIKVYGPGAGDSSASNPSNPPSPYDISLTYDPNAGANGEITTVLNTDPPHTTPLTAATRASGVEFTHFGLNILGDPNGGGFRTGTFYFDDVTYSVIPEPTSLGLLGLGILALGGLLIRRKR